MIANMTKCIWLTLSLLLMAQSAMADPGAAGTPLEWTVEGGFQAQSVAGTASPRFGPALTYRIFGNERLGFRFISSISQAVDEGAYTLDLLWRHEFSERPTHLFLEGNGAYNIVRSTDFASGGLVIGVVHLLTADLGLGGTAGFELAGKSVKSTGVTDSGSSTKSYPALYPKISVFGVFYL